MTVREVIQRSAEFLAKKGVESPRLRGELLLAHVLRVPRLELYLDLARALANEEAAAVRELVRRCGNREPVQYLTGSTSFCGLELEVNPRVLIPRPETELLAERAWRVLGAQAPGWFLREPAPSGSRAPAGTPGSGPARETVRVLDFGTGSGCLAIAVAARCPEAVVHALDISADALDVARRNAARHGLAERVRFVCGDGFAALPGEARFDLVLANPPYIATSELARLQPEVRDHEPRLALDGGSDGLEAIRRLAAEGRAWMRPNGCLLMEFGDGQAEAVRGLFAAGAWTIEAIESDYAGQPRMLVAHPAAPAQTGVERGSPVV